MIAKLNGCYFWLKIRNCWKYIIIFEIKSIIILKKEFDCESIYNKKTLKTKIRSGGDEAKDFYTRKISETGSNYIWWFGNWLFLRKYKKFFSVWKTFFG